MIRRDVDQLLAAIVAALERGDRVRAMELLGLEGRVFLAGFESVAAEMGFARRQLDLGDGVEALRVILAIPRRAR